MAAPSQSTLDLLNQALARVAKSKRVVEAAEKAEADRVKSVQKAQHTLDEELHYLDEAQQRALTARCELQDLERLAESCRLDTLKGRGQETALPDIVPPPLNEQPRPRGHATPPVDTAASRKRARQKANRLARERSPERAGRESDEKDQRWKRKQKQKELGAAMRAAKLRKKDA